MRDREMRNLRWMCWYLWEGLPTLLAFPIDSAEPSGTGESWFSNWEDHWPRYAIGTFGFVVVAFTLAGCLCCRRQRRPKGFQDDAGNDKEFKDGSTAGTETTIERHPSASLELEVPRIASSTLTASTKVQFEALPIDRFAADSRIAGKPKPPSPSLFSDEQEIEKNFLREQPCREWFEDGNCHVPRERLKYLREIGRGWFGKVVEGTTTENPDNSTKNRGVVVRILTEEATTKEKAWFLGEATPYLKLQHPNILALLGSCLETDPYLLLFESCPAGDLKGFLRSNRDKGTCEALRKENVPTRMALDIANALEHMHENGFAHTDLSARNCLVAPDLSAKLGDYGTGVEKYPGDYYVVGDRALPIRWSAPESLECTATTIETRAITPRANLWSYGVLLWEMVTWGERPYDNLGDEQVIEMIFSLKTGFPPHGTSPAMLKKFRDELDIPKNFGEAIEASWKFFPDDRASLNETREIISGKRIEDFEKRWENLRPNGTNVEARTRDNRSASLQDLRDSGENELFFEEKDSSTLQAQFRLGPDEPVKNVPSSRQSCQESGSETEEESWRGRVERGAYTEKVKQKSKSVADLMILVHIDSDSDAEISLGPQNTEKSSKKRLPASGSDGDLRSTVLADEFDETIRKLREPSICNGTILKTTKNPLESAQNTENLEKPKLLTLTQQGQTPILRLSLGTLENLSNSRIFENVEKRLENVFPQKNISTNATIDEFFDNERAANNSLTVSSSSREDKSIIRNLVEETVSSLAASPKIDDKRVMEDSARKLNSTAKTESPRIEGHVLRLVSKGDPDLPLLRYVPEGTSKPEEPLIDETLRFDSFLMLEPRDSGVACFSNNFEDSRAVANSVDVELWNNALAYELEKKNPGYDVDATIFDNFDKSTIGDDPAAACTRTKVRNDRSDDESEEAIKRSQSVPNTPNKRGNFTIQSSSAPNTPRNYYRDEIDKDAINGSSSAAPYSAGNLEEDSSTGDDFEASERMLKGIASAPDTPQSRGNYSVGNGDEDSSTGEDLETGMIKRSSHEAEDDEDRKHLSTPDDERSSDSGFRDKESCEEEESPVPCPTSSSIILTNTITPSSHAASSSPLSASAEEEQMRILFELDTILDAEYYGSFHDSDKLDDIDTLSPSNVKVQFVENEDIVGRNLSISESLESTESTDVVETVRANSCEPDFLDSRASREPRHGEELRKFEDFLITERREDAKNCSDICDATEAHSISECSPKSDKNQNVELSSSLEINERQNASPDSDKNYGTDSPVEFCRFHVDSSGSRGKLNESTDLSLELRSSNPSSPCDDFEKHNESSPTCGTADLADSNSESPLKSDKHPSIDISLDVRANGSSEIYKASEIDLSDSTSQSPLKTDKNSEGFYQPSELENLTNDSAKTERKSEDFGKPSETSEICEASETELENSASDSPLKTDRCQTSDFSMETRGADSVHSDAEQWSSRENVNDNENDDEDSSTMSLRSDNSYVSFGLDEEFVAAIRNELREKLPRAQMPVVEALDPRDEKEPSINEDAETKRWEDEETEENSERGSGGVDISIRYNIYGTPLSPILEERESAGTSESLISKEDSRDASIASRVSALSEDVLVVDTRTNRAMMLEGTASGNEESSNLQQDEDRDTSHGDFSDEENLEYPQNNLNRGMESKRISMGSVGAPLPSPEEESKWQQQFPLPLQMQDDLMSTSFGTDRDWDSQDEDEGEDDGEDGEDDEEENSSSSGEFVWKRYDESHGDLENVATRSPPNKPKSQEPEADLDDDEGDEDDEEEEEEFTPSAWDATLAPHRSALRSPEKTLKSGDQKKSVWFKKQRYHCVYEYPKDIPVAEGQGQAAANWEPTSYADWEEMMDEPRLDVYPMEYDETNRAGDEEFYVSSSNRPFQFQSGDGKYVSQFFPGASSTLLQQQQQQQLPLSREPEDCEESQDEVDRADISVSQTTQTNGNARGLEFVDNQQQMQQTQLGELRHTRDRLKLNLLSTSGTAKTDEEVGAENRTLDIVDTENSDEQTGRTLKQKTDAPEIEISPKFVQKLSKDESSLELKTLETEIIDNPLDETTKLLEVKSEDKKSLSLKSEEIEIIECPSIETTKLQEEKSEDKISLDLDDVENNTVKKPSDDTMKSLEEKSEDKKSLELKTVQTEIVDHSSKVTEILSKEKFEKKQNVERPMNDEFSKIEKQLSENDEESIECAIEEISSLKTENSDIDFNESGTSSMPKNGDTLTMREALKMEKNKQVDEKAFGTRNTFSNDDLAVIQGNDEVDSTVEISSSREDSRSIGDQKDSSNSKYVDVTNESVAGQIVDISKLETEESFLVARQPIESNSVIVEKAENTAGAIVRDTNVVPSTNEKTDEYVVHSSQS